MEEFFRNLFFGNDAFWGGGVAHSVLILAVVISLGVALGKIKIAGVRLGVTWILFVGITFSHFGMQLNEHLLHFLKEFGLILFVYSIGLQVGPSFFSSFKKGGVQLNLMATGIVLLGVVITYVIYLITGLPITTMVGILSGAVTNTPGLGAAQQAYSDMTGIDSPDIAMGYAVAYPLGVLGIILSMIFIRWIFRIRFEEEDKAYTVKQGGAHEAVRISVEVKNPFLDGKTVLQIKRLINRQFVISRVLHPDGRIDIAGSQTPLSVGDKALIVTTTDDMGLITDFVGEKLDMDKDEWERLDNQLISRRIMITKSKLNGQYIGAFAPYGYVKHPKDKHQLIIDPDAAEIVKLIFSLFLKGTSKRAIALYLNEHGVPSPSAYKLQKGIPVSTRGYDDPMWGARMIHSILTNPTYTGDLAQGRSRVKSYKVHEVESVPREEWVEVAGTHEAIIDYETFDKVQALLQRDTRTSPKGREVHLFSGFLKCADCGRAITRSVGNNNNVYYACSTYKNRSRTACTMHSIKHNRLEAAVLFAVQQQIHLAVSYSEMIARINTAPVKKSQSIRLEELIAAKERELTKISRYKQSLYQDWKDGEITQQDYRDMKADYERQTIALTDVLARLNAERAELANGVKSEHPALVAFTKHQNIDQLSRELLVELIDHIKVYENGNISVRFKFADEFRRIAECIEINTTKPAVAG